jgi:uncharacterized membrane protein
MCDVLSLSLVRLHLLLISRKAYSVRLSVRQAILKISHNNIIIIIIIIIVSKHEYKCL